MTSPLAAYDALVAAGELRPDPDQAAAARRLEALATELEATPKRGSILWRLAGQKPTAPRGIYLWGGVGRGKSMLMDLFFANLDIRRKRRVHFSEFMIEVHDRIAIERRKELGDPIVPVAAGLAEEARCLAFDEMMVTNSPDAMILSRLFTALIEAGVTVVTTSNRPPRDLYKDGLNREHFLPFIALVEQRLDVLPLNGPVDYRRDRLGAQDSWLVPNGAKATAELSAAFFRLTDYPPEDRAHVPSTDLACQGADAARPQVAEGGGRLLVQEAVRRGAGGGRLSGDRPPHYHTVILVGIPVLDPGRTATRRHASWR